MPALLTHDFFGQDMLARITGDFFNRANDEALSAELRRAFLLGNQGPDPLFYAQLTPSFARAKQFGTLMHAEKAAETLAAFRRIALCAAEPDQSLLLAYLLGFLCHYSLDCTVHPFVYAQQYAICDAGVKGLDRRDGQVVHGQIEADLDAMMLAKRGPGGVSGHRQKYDYPQRVLLASDETLRLLDQAYIALAHEVYAQDLPQNSFVRGVKDMRMTVALMCSPRGVKRSFIGRLERIGRRHSLVQAMSPRLGIGDSCDFDNHQHDEWTNPFTNEASTASFDQLYAHALELALRNITLLMAQEPTAKITNGLNFEGAERPLPE